ncbi:hypothetical protein CWN95_16480 [Vibrio splendidus]|nr:hypothetical protein CWN95_16480 [Vibrio splendidus]
MKTCLAYRKFDDPETKNQWQIFSTTDDFLLSVNRLLASRLLANRLLTNYLLTNYLLTNSYLNERELKPLVLSSLSQTSLLLGCPCSLASQVLF